MKTVLNIAVMIALCANTALVAADKTTAENDARNLMSNIVSSFESGDTRSIEKMVKDEKFRGSLLDMIRHSPRPLFLRLEMDSMLMAEPYPSKRSRKTRRATMLSPDCTFMMHAYASSQKQ